MGGDGGAGQVPLFQSVHHPHVNAQDLVDGLFERIDSDLGNPGVELAWTPVSVCRGTRKPPDSKLQ
jgi:hypothetical protein